MVLKISLQWEERLFPAYLLSSDARSYNTLYIDILASFFFNLFTVSNALYTALQKSQSLCLCLYSSPLLCARKYVSHNFIRLPIIRNLNRNSVEILILCHANVPRYLWRIVFNVWVINYRIFYFCNSFSFKDIFLCRTTE